MTSLLDTAQYSALTLAREYHQRWEIEITIDELNTHQRLPNLPLRSQTPAGVLQEAYGLLLAHYAVRAIMHEAALEHAVDPDRLSFTAAVTIICDALAKFQMTTPEQLPQLYRRLLNDIVQQLLPERDQRSNPRVVKRKMSKFNLKRAKHQQWPQPTKTFQAALVLLN